MELQHGNQMLWSNPLDPVHVRKSSMDLARHTTVDMTLRVYARSRWERRGEQAEAVGRMVNPGQESEKRVQASVQALAVGAERETGKALPDLELGGKQRWCERGDLNPHDLAAAGP